MLDAPLYGGLDQVAGIHGVVVVIPKRIGDRHGNNDRRGKVDDCRDPVLGDDRGHESLVSGVAENERHSVGNDPVKASGKVVEDNGALTGIGQLINHVASDVASTAGNEDRHALLAWEMSRAIEHPLRAACGEIVHRSRTFPCRKSA